jgi:hypothetical protein
MLIKWMLVMLMMKKLMLKKVASMEDGLLLMSLDPLKEELALTGGDCIYTYAYIDISIFGVFILN